MWTKLKTRLFFEEILETDASVTEGAPSLLASAALLARIIC